MCCICHRNKVRLVTADALLVVTRTIERVLTNESVRGVIFLCVWGLEGLLKCSCIIWMVIQWVQVGVWFGGCTGLVQGIYGRTNWGVQ